MARRKKREEAPLSLFSFQDIMACLTGILIMVALLLAIDGLSDDPAVNPGKAGAPEASTSAERLPLLREQIAVLQRVISDRKGGVDVTKAEVDLLDDRIKQMALVVDKTRRRLVAAEEILARTTSEQSAVEIEIVKLRDRIVAIKQSAVEQTLRERVKFRPGMKYPKAPVFVEVTSTGINIGELDSARTPVQVAKIADPNANARLVGSLGKRLPDSTYMVFVVHEDSIARFEELRDKMIRRGYEVGWQLWDELGGNFLDGAKDSTGPVPLEVPENMPINKGNSLPVTPTGAKP